MNFIFIINNTMLMISLLECSPLSMAAKSLAYSSENNKLVFPRSNQAQEILGIFIDLLSLFEDTRKNRRGHIWDAEVVSSGTRATKPKSNATTAKVPVEDDFFRKFYEFLISNDENNHI